MSPMWLLLTILASTSSPAAPPELSVSVSIDEIRVAGEAVVALTNGIAPGEDTIEPLRAAIPDPVGREVVVDLAMDVSFDLLLRVTGSLVRADVRRYTIRVDVDGQPERLIVDLGPKGTGGIFAALSGTREPEPEEPELELRIELTDCGLHVTTREGFETIRELRSE